MLFEFGISVATNLVGSLFLRLVKGALSGPPFSMLSLESGVGSQAYSVIPKNRKSPLAFHYYFFIVPSISCRLFSGVRNVLSL